MTTSSAVPGWETRHYKEFQSMSRREQYVALQVAAMDLWEKRKAWQNAANECLEAGFVIGERNKDVCTWNWSCPFRELVLRCRPNKDKLPIPMGDPIWR